MAKRLLTADGKPRPKGKPRGNPQAIAAYKFKPGNTLSRGRRVRISDEVQKELNRVDNGLAQGTALARGLVERAKKDSSELERVIRITEPHLLQSSEGNQRLDFGFRLVYDEHTDPAGTLDAELITNE